MRQRVWCARMLLTRILSESMMVLRRWAMVRTVQSMNCSLRASWMMPSVLGTHTNGIIRGRDGERGREGEREHSLDIDVGGGLVKNQDLVLLEERSGQADQLPLAYTEVGPALRYQGLQPSLQLLHSSLQLYLWLPGETGWGIGMLLVT